jgi:signal transduction histidine kinase
MSAFQYSFKSKTVKRYDYRQVFLDFNKSLHTIKDKTLLVSSIMTRIYELIPAKGIYLFWKNSDKNRYDRIDAEKSELYLLPEDGLIKWLQLNEKPLLVSFTAEYAGIYSTHDADVVNGLGCKLICPLKANSELKGIVLMGERDDHRPYRLRDLDVLFVLLDNAALAIENITYHEERTEHLRHIFRTDRLAIIGQLAAGAAHEIRNPLTSIKSAMQYIQADVREPRKQAILHSALAEVDRINTILAGLLSFSRQNDPVKNEFDLAELMEQTLLLMLKKQIVFETSFCAPRLPIVADRDQIKQVLMNILLNAIDAIIDGEGRIRVDIRMVRMEEKMSYVITVTDSGRGFDAENMERIFDPFFTTKEEGTGLGLSISYGIIRRHRGNIEVGNHPGGGAQVTIQLPVS